METSKFPLFKQLMAEITNQLKMFNFGSAVFWSDKLVKLCPDSLTAKLLLVQSLFLSGKFVHAAELIKVNRWHEGTPLFTYFMAKCYFSAHKIGTALQLLEADGFMDSVSSFIRSYRPVKSELPEAFSVEFVSQLESSVHLLLAEIFKSLNNIELAVQHYRLALQHNLFCVEAFDALATGNLLPVAKKNEILTPMRQQISGSDASRNLAYLMYCQMFSTIPVNLNMNNSADENSIVAVLHDNFCDDADLICVKAESLYQKVDYVGARRLLENCVRRNPHNSRALLLFVAVLYSTGDYNELFRLGSLLAENEPGSAMCYYVSGVYYLAICNHDGARQQFARAVQRQPHFAAAWLARGHSFADQREHDHALTAYVTAAQVAPGSVMPLLCIGLMHMMAGSLINARHFFEQARASDPMSPDALCAFAVHSFYTAITPPASGSSISSADADRLLHEADYLLTAATQLVERVGDGRQLAVLYNNLGHVNRKLKKYDTAADYHRRALNFDSRHADTHVALALALALDRKYAEAIRYIDRALCLKPDDSDLEGMLTTISKLYAFTAKPTCSLLSNVLPTSENIMMVSGKPDTFCAANNTSISSEVS